MNITPKFLGCVDDSGRLLFGRTPHESERERKNFARFLKTLRNRDVEIVVKKKTVQRSLDQNAYLHAVPFPLLAEHFGMTISEVKYSLMGEKWGWRKDPISGREIPIKPSTSDMTVEECTQFIEWLLIWAATEHDVYIPSPERAEAA